MTPASPLPTLGFVIIVAVGVLLDYALFGLSGRWQSIWLIILFFIVGVIFAMSIKIADQWTRAIVLRLGRFHALRGPGLFFIIPVIDTIPYWIDIRVITSSFHAERGFGAADRGKVW